MAENPYFMRALLGGLSEHLQNAHKEQARRNMESEAQDRSVFEAMLKTDNPELQSLGLAGLMEKPGKGWFGKLRESKVKPQVDAILNRAKYASKVVPSAAEQPPSAPEEISTPKPTAAAPPSEPSSTAQSSTAPAQGGAMTLTPGVSAPPEPGYSFTDPTSTGGMEPIEDIQAQLSAPPSPPPSMTPPPSYSDMVEERRRQFHERSPLSEFKLSPFEDRQIQAQAAGLGPDEIREGLRSEMFPHQANAEAAMQRILANIQGRKDAESLKHQPYILQGDEAEWAGLPEGTPIDRAVFLQLVREHGANGRAAMSAAARKYAADKAANSAVIQVDTIGEDGVPVRRVIPRSEAAGQTFEKPAPVNAQNKAHQARVIIQRGEELKEQIRNNPQMGPILGRIAKGEIDLGTVAPDVRALYTALESFTDLQPALHGSRGVQYAERFKKAIGGLETNPAAVIASIDELQNTAQDFQNEVKPRHTVAPPPTKPSAGGAAASPVPPIAQREIGKSYILKNGKIGVWTGVGFKETQ